MNVPKIMVFRPSMEEFKDFSRYIQYMESQGAHHAGVAKVIPPKEWTARQNYDNIDNMIIPAPIEQVVTGQKGLYTQFNIEKKPMTVKEFRQLTNTPRYEPPFYESFEELERMYWKNITFNSAIYGADISGSLYDKDVDVWNVARLNTLLDVIESDSGVKIEGVNTAYLYFGMWKTTFAWHTEDMDLYSINYVHFGAPKSWYAIPPDHGKRLERLSAGFYPNAKSNCSSFLRHKMTLISPTILKEYGIPVNKITQEAGEFMITFPYGYHAGFNHGFNCAESTNFASERWIDYGKAAEKCTCRNDTVTIDMDRFVQLFQPQNYEKWKVHKQETKPYHNDWPAQPDLTAPYPSWLEKIDEYRKLYDISGLRAKLEKGRKPEKISSKLKRQMSCSPSKVPQKRKQKRKNSPTKLENTVKSLEEDKSINNKMSDIISLRLDDLSPGISGLSDKSKQCLFDRIKSGARRKSSAKPLSSSEDIEEALGKDSINPTIPLSLNPLAENSKLSSPKSTQSPITCSVNCQPLQTFPYEVVSEEPLVLKEQAKPASKLKRRRHPVNEKSSKKTSSNVLIKCAHSDTNNPVDEASTSSCVLDSAEPAGFKDEMKYNSLVAKIPPHCAVCSLFQPYFKNPICDMTTKRGLPSRLPQANLNQPNHVAGDRTAPLVSEVSFASNLNSPSPLAECQLLDQDGKSPLLQCYICHVQVHASCYGVQTPPESSGRPWVCARCVDGNWAARCSLCCLRGGALKQISGGQNWAHIVCAIAIPDVYFENTVLREGINVSKLPAKKQKLKCVYGGKSVGRAGVCLQCCSSRCPVAFHVTCAHAAGLLVEPGNWPFPIYVHCHKHTLLRTKGKEVLHLPIAVDSYVLAKHKNGKYYQAKVTRLKKVNFFKVNFKDNTWSDNLYAEDIISHNWSSGELPVVGSMVEVQWTDGQVYNAEYRGHSMQQTIQVEFDDGLLVDFERNEIFTADDEIPAKIKRKLRTQNATPLKPVGSE